MKKDDPGVWVAIAALVLEIVVCCCLLWWVYDSAVTWFAVGGWYPWTVVDIVHGAR